MTDLSPGQDVRVSGASGGAARVIYVRGNSVRVRILATGKERTVELASVKAAPVSKSLTAGSMEPRNIGDDHGENRAERLPSPLRPVPKPLALTSPAYLTYVRKHPCCSCGRSEDIEAHHWSHHGGAMGAKVDDYRTVPLCQEHHRYWHDHGTLPGEGRAESEWTFKYHQRRLLTAWVDDAFDDHGDAVDALIRAIGGADA